MLLLFTDKLVTVSSPTKFENLATATGICRPRLPALIKGGFRNACRGISSRSYCNVFASVFVGFSHFSLIALEATSHHVFIQNKLLYTESQFSLKRSQKSAMVGEYLEGLGSKLPAAGSHWRYGGKLPSAQPPKAKRSGGGVWLSSVVYFILFTILILGFEFVVSASALVW